MGHPESDLSPTDVTITRRVTALNVADQKGINSPEAKEIQAEIEGMDKQLGWSDEESEKAWQAARFLRSTKELADDELEERQRQELLSVSGSKELTAVPSEEEARRSLEASWRIAQERQRTGADAVPPAPRQIEKGEEKE